MHVHVCRRTFGARPHIRLGVMTGRCASWAAVAAGVPRSVKLRTRTTGTRWPTWPTSVPPCPWPCAHACA
eukprot:6138103-Prymnesium_polylepis.2